MGKACERVFDVTSLECRNLEKLESDAFCEGGSIMRTHRHSVLEVYLVGYHYSNELLALVLLFDALKPLSQQVECVWVSHVVD